MAPGSLITASTRTIAGFAEADFDRLVQRGLVKWVGYALYPRWQLFLQAMSAAILLWGTVFVRGWDIQSYGGATLTERVNRTLYLILYVSGTTLGVFATLSPTLSHY